MCWYCLKKGHTKDECKIAKKLEVYKPFLNIQNDKDYMRWFITK